MRLSRAIALSKDYAELSKPTITWLILGSTAVGYYFGLGSGHARWLVLFHTLLGTGLLASGTATLNEWYEHEADAKMRRTQSRPIPSGRVSPGGALAFGVFLSALGFADLALAVNMAAALWGMATLGTYLLLYTPLKQRTRHATTIGAFPGAMPPLIGYAAAAGGLSAQAWVLFAILFLWQFPHFLSIAWMYREDYGRAGIMMLPVVEPDGKSTARHIVLASLLLIPASLAPGFLHMTGTAYLFGASALGVVFLSAGVRAALERTRPRARQVLLASVVYLPLLYGLMLLDRPAS
jgi:protoheme IX farnesyltransferase